jgi:phosphatidylserine decarboxylase
LKKKKVAFAILIGSLLAFFPFVISFPSLPGYIGRFLSPQVHWPRYILRQSIEMGRVDGNFLRFFNRDPKRVVPSEENIIVSPADGWVKAILDNKDKYSICIAMRLYDVHVNYFPISGKIIQISEEGIKIDDISYREWELNYRGIGEFKAFQKITVLQTRIGIVTVRQITNWWARRIRVFHEVGDDMHIGDKLGRILLGSSVVLEIPKINPLNNQEIELLVKEADKSQPVDERKRISGGETIVARY